jgi:hypothetical protein
MASRSHGVVTRRQLLRAGVTVRQIERRVAGGGLIHEYLGVYRVGHRAPGVEATYLAAVLACGDGAVLSGRAAAFLFGLLKGRPPPPDVTAPGRRRVRGVRTHRSWAIEAITWRGVPVTTVPRTMVDIAGDLTEDELARACHEAGIRSCCVAWWSRSARRLPWSCWCPDRR